MFHELMSRDREDGCATGKPQGVGPCGVLDRYAAGMGVPPGNRRGQHPRTPGRTAISVVVASNSWNIRARSRQVESEVGKDLLDNLLLSYERYDPHLPIALRAESGIDLVHPVD
jgi:hypothetical protein